MELIRKTKSVKAILNFFYNKEEAISSIDLVEHFQGEMNKTTVYRILKRLVEIGTLHVLNGKDDFRWYAMRKHSSLYQQTQTHPHFKCHDCGKTKCLDQELYIPSVPNHKILSAELLLTGQCEDCLS